LPVNYKNFTANKLNVNALVIGTNELWSAVGCPASAENQATAWDTTDNIGQIKQIGTCAGAVNTMNPNPNQVDLCYDCGGTSGKNRVVYGAQGSGGNNVIHVFDGTGLTRNCASSLTNSDTVSSRASLAYLGNSIDKFAIGRTGNDVLIVNNNDLCTVNTTITSAELGSSNFIRGIDVNVHNSQWMVYYGSAGTIAKVAVMDLSTLANLHSLQQTLTANGAGMETNSFFATDSNLTVLKNKVFVTDTTSTGRMWVLDAQGGSNIPAGETKVCIDSNGDRSIGGTDICFVDCNDDGFADSAEGTCGSNGTIGVTNILGQNATNIGFQWGCMFGVSSCTDQNPKTNGVGLVYLLILLILSYAFLVSIHYQALRLINKANVQVMDVLHINPIFLLVMLIVDVGIIWQFKWIDDLIFYSLVAISTVGIVAFGLYKKIVPSGGG
jgi:hypothetical protein